MKPYKNKQELLEAIQDKYQKYITEFDGIPEELKNKRSNEVDRTPSENVSYQLGGLIYYCSGIGTSKVEKMYKRLEMAINGIIWEDYINLSTKTTLSTH